MFLLFLLLAPFVQAYELSIAAIFKNEGRFLKEWVEYHRMAGVEYFWMYNQESEDDWRKVLQPYMDEGIMEVVDWPIPRPLTEHFVEYQIAAYQDALTKSKGKTKWLALIDIDEFVLPMVGKTIPECLKRCFPKASGVYANWRNFGTGRIVLEEEEPILFRLTASAEREHSQNAIGKSIVQPDAVVLEAIDSPHFFGLAPGADYFNADGDPLEFEGNYLLLDGLVHDRWIRINHYALRDEIYFHSVKIPRVIDLRGEREIQLTWEHYFNFSRDFDYKIMDFIMENHPDEYERIWKNN